MIASCYSVISFDGGRGWSFQGIAVFEVLREKFPDMTIRDERSGTARPVGDPQNVPRNVVLQLDESATMLAVPSEGVPYEHQEEDAE